MLKERTASHKAVDLLGIALTLGKRLRVEPCSRPPECSTVPWAIPGSV